MHKKEDGNILTIILFAVYMLMLTGIILFKLPFYSPEISDGIRVINLIPLQGSFDENGVIVWSEIAQNILIFVPLGVYISMLKSTRPLLKKVLPIIGLTFAFEIIQFIFALGRTDITDILCNTIGGIIGISFYSLMWRVFKSKTNMIMGIIALVVTIIAVGRFSQLFYLSHFVMGNI